MLFGVVCKRVMLFVVGVRCVFVFVNAGVVRSMPLVALVVVS